jgi:hypothetical protein
MSSRVATRPEELGAGVAFWGACALFVAAPYERLEPLFKLPGQNVTTVEAAIAAATGVWLLAIAATRRWPRWRTPLTWPAALWLGASALAALAAPVFHVSAIKIVARLAIGFVALLLAANGVSSPRRLTVVIWIAVASATVVGLLTVLDYAGVPAVLNWLSAFHNGFWVVGGQMRASGTFQYPTITSMYLEIAFALALGGFLQACDRQKAVAGALLFAAALLIAEGVIVTFTRAGLITMAASLAMVAASRYGRLRVDRGLAGICGIGALIALLVISSTSLESLRLRLTTQGQEDWYRAGFLIPKSLSLAPSSLNLVEATVINKGRVTWHPDASPPFHVSYHWLDEQLNRVVRYDGLRTALPRPVPPGDSLRVAVQVRAPREVGRYRLGWDVVQEGRLWFSAEPGSRLAWSAVTVSGPPAEEEPVSHVRPSPTFLPEQAVRLARPALWRAAFRMSAAHPIVGVGPDNFRLSYGAYAGVANADPRVTSNNMFLEVLTGSGILGTAAFLFLCWRTRGVIRGVRRRLPPAAWSIYSGVAAAAFAIVLHGLVDSFLTFTPTYLVISLTLGLAIAPASWTEALADAHRV